VVVCRPPNTILPGSGRPTGRLGGGIGRHGARYDRTRNCWYFERNNESNDDANSFRNNVSNNYMNN
jgi:hypothetical protein